jgi:hypothetical protein
MATQYTSILKLALPTQGELSGTWGDVVNDNITSMVEEAIAGRSVINSWAANSHTLTTADGLTSESRAAMLEFTDTGTALSGAATVICPTATKIYVCKNGAGQTVTVKTAAGTGVAIPNGETMFVFCDGTNVVQAVTSLTTLKVGTGIQVSTILDEDNMASDSATALATQQSIKAYVDAQITAQDLDFAGDTGTGAVDLDSQTFTVAGTANEIETSASGQTITIGLPTAIVVTTITTTNVQATNIKANDGTAAITIADSTGQVTVTDAVLTTADINGGTADNVTIGGSTAAAGSFTTLGASGTTTLSGALALTGNLDINTNKFNVTAVDGNTLIAGTLGVTGNVDLNGGAIDGTVIGGSTAAAGTFTTGQFNTSLNVDGTTNLDVVDIDGAVDMASTLTVGGTTNDGTALVQIAQSGTGRAFSVNRNVVSATRAVVNLAQLQASGGAEAVLDIQQTTPASRAIKVTPDGSIDRFSVYGTGALVTTPVAGGHAVFNEGGVDADFRVESDTNTHALFVEGSSSNVGIGTSSLTEKLTVVGTTKVGEGVASNTSKLMVNTASGTAAGIQLFQDGVESWIIQNPASTTALTFANSGSERLRITATGNVGIGTSSPSTKGHFYSATSMDQLTVDGTGAIEAGINFANGGTTYGQIYFNNVSPYDMSVLQQYLIGSLIFGTNDTERMRIDASGNVGIGVVPSTDHNPVVEALQIGSTANLFGRNDAEVTTLTSNSYLSVAGFPKYITTNEASEYTQSSGNHIWYNAPSGTAGAACTQTERMRIDSSGNLLVGTTSTIPFTFSSGTGAGITSTGTVMAGATAEAGLFNRIGSDGSIVNFYKAGAVVGSIGTSASSIYIGGTSNGAIYFNGTTDVRPWNTSTQSNLDNTMDLGTSAARFKDLYLSGNAYVGNAVTSSTDGSSDLKLEGNQHIFRRGSAGSYAEKARIDSSGNLLVGRSSAGAAATDNGHVFYGSGQHYIFSNATECVRFYETSGSGQQVGSISITSSATAFNTSSDERLKENITDAPAGNVDDIKVRSFDWKADGSHQDYGMVAQELEAVAPYAVTKGETEDDMWSVDYSKLVPMLIKEIQDLKAEVAALKGAN